jgi:hypothetical protein
MEAKLATKFRKDMESLDARHTETRILPFFLKRTDQNPLKGGEEFNRGERYGIRMTDHGKSSALKKGRDTLELRCVEVGWNQQERSEAASSRLACSRRPT